MPSYIIKVILGDLSRTFVEKMSTGMPKENTYFNYMNEYLKLMP